jgi:hypothetical protein
MLLEALLRGCTLRLCPYSNRSFILTIGYVLEGYKAIVYTTKPLLLRRHEVKDATKG